jgi:hypothetical protein
MNPLIIKMNFAKKSKNPKNYHGSLYLSISCYIGHELVVDGFFFFFFFFLLPNIAATPALPSQGQQQPK